MTSYTLKQHIAYHICLYVVTVCALLTTSYVQAAPNYQINYQGKLTDGANVTVPDGLYNMRFWLLTSPDIATTSAVWTESLTGSDRVQVTNGVFSIMLGSTTPLDNVDFSQTLYLGVEIGGTSTPVWDGEMSPRKVLGAVPVAFEAGNAGAVGGVASTSLLRSDEADTASGLLTFTGGIISNASSTITELTTLTATTTAFVINGERFTDLTGSGLINTSGALTCATANGSTFGCLSVGDWVVFNSKVSSSSIDTSAELASLVTDETGSGSLVFASNPLLQGFRSNASSTIADLTVAGNSTTTGSAYFVGNVGVGTNGMAAKLHVLSTTEQLRLGYDASNYLSTTIGSTGGVTFDAAGSGSSFTFSDAVIVSANAGLSTRYAGLEVFKVTRGTVGSFSYGAFVDNKWDSGWVPFGVKAAAGQIAPIFQVIDGSNAVLMNVAANGNVGIGTTTSSSRLLIQSSGTATYPLLIAASSSPAFARIRETGGGYFTFGLGDASGNEDIFLDSNGSSWFNGGNVGIGTTSPKIRLQVAKDALYNSELSAALALSNATTPLKMLVAGYDGTADASYLQSVHSTVGYKSLLLNPNGGNVGIGTTTPEVGLSIAGTDSFGLLHLSNTSANGTVSVSFRSSDDPNGGAGQWLIGKNLGGLSGDQFSIWQGTAGNRLAIDSSGKIGIGTSTPSDMLQIKTGLAFTDNWPSIGFNMSPSSNLNLNTDPVGMIQINNTSGGLRFYTGVGGAVGAAATYAERMAIAASGNVGIGTTSPSVKLEVAGGVIRNRGDFASIELVQNNAVGFRWTLDGAGKLYLQDTTNAFSSAVHNPIFLADSATGYIGIATTSPDHSLTIASNNRYTYTAGNALALVASSNPLLQLRMGYDGVNDIAFLQAQNKNIAAKNIALNPLGGNVGIGTVTPSSSLHVHGTTTESVGQIRLSNGGSWPLILNQDQSSLFTIQNGGATRFVITPSGSVGIGSSTPIAKLSVKGGGTGAGINFQTTDSSDRPLLTIFDSGNVGVGNQTIYAGNLFNVKGGMLLENGASVSTSTRNAGLHLWSDNAFGAELHYGTPSLGQSGGWATALYGRSTDSAALRFGAYAGSATAQGAFQEYATILNSGNFGIGTTTPSHKLTVAGTSTMQTILPAGPYIGNMSAFSLGSSTSRWNSVWAGTYNVGTSTWSLSATGPDRFGIFNAASGGGTEVLSILQSGNVGIGTTTPGSKFTVAGDLNFTGNLYQNGQLFSTAAPSAGEGWTSRTSAADNSWSSVTYGNGLFVAVASFASSNYVMTSPDGINWTPRPGINRQWTSVTYGNGMFVAVAQSGTGNRVMTSPDGITWTSRSSAANNNWDSVTYGNGVFVAVSNTGADNRVMTSPDGINWTIRTGGAFDLWQSVTYGNGLFVAVASSGDNRVMTSPDGVTWTNRTSAANNAWNSVTYGNGLFVAVAGYSTGSGDRVMTSPDGINWTLRASAADIGWHSVTYGNGLFVAVACGMGTIGCDTAAGNTRVMTSPDGINWTLRASATDSHWYSVTYGNGMFVAVAQSGTGNRVMTSGKTETSALAHNNIYQGGMSIMGGNLGIGTTTGTSTLTIQGSLCVRNTGACGTTAGTIYATTASITDIDLAENYATADDTIEAGEIVAVDLTAPGHIKRARRGDVVLGIISTAPGLLLGQEIQNSKPVALSGRVPIRVNMEGGPIEIGDRIMLSSVPGIGTKATTSAQTVGIALEGIDEDGAIEVFVTTEYSIFGDMQAGLNYVAEFALEPEDGGETLWERLKMLAQNFINGVLRVAGIRTDELCIGNTCVNEALLIELLENANLTGLEHEEGPGGELGDEENENEGSEHLPEDQEGETGEEATEPLTDESDDAVAEEEVVVEEGNTPEEENMEDVPEEEEIEEPVEDGGEEPLTSLEET